jgi:hypothetical protein
MSCYYWRLAGISVGYVDKVTVKNDEILGALQVDAARNGNL